MIQGIKITPGYGIGRAVILHNLNQMPPIAEHTVLIAKHVSEFEKALPVMENVSGMILETQTNLKAFQAMAGQFSIPAIAGARDVCHAVYNGEPVIVDGTGGLLIINPDLDTEKDYLALQNGLLL